MLVVGGLILIGGARLAMGVQEFRSLFVLPGESGSMLTERVRVSSWLSASSVSVEWSDVSPFSSGSGDGGVTTCISGLTGPKIGRPSAKYSSYHWYWY